MKKTRKNLFHDSSGVSLIAAVFLILVLSFLGWVMVSMSTLASRESVNELYSAQAYYDACSAVEAAIVELDMDAETAEKGLHYHYYYHYQFEQGKAVVDAEKLVDAGTETPDYWKLTVTATNGTDGSADYAKRRLIVKFLKKL
jgi:Tfp pilus assembly protein PilX